MSDRFEKMIEDIFDSEEFFSDDKLSDIINRETDSEIEIDDLYYVAAAQKSDFQHFWKSIETNDSLHGLK